LPTVRGTVAEDASEPLLPVELLGGVGNGGEEASLEVESVIDTGFDGELTLPRGTIRRLRYPYAGSAGGTLADGSEVATLGDPAIVRRDAKAA
jgi:predicted aspartyl protease